MACPGESLFQFGQPRSERPAITVVRMDWLLSSESKAGSITEPPSTCAARSVVAVTSGAIGLENRFAGFSVAQLGAIWRQRSLRHNLAGVTNALLSGPPIS